MKKKKNNIAYVHSTIGYAPLSVRIIERYYDKWLELKNIFPDVEIGEFPEQQQQQLQQQQLLQQQQQQQQLLQQQQEATLIYFIGGITYAEISALRLLAKNKKFTKENVIIATTKVISGNSLMTSMFEPLE